MALLEFSRLDKVARKLPMRSLEQVKLRFALLEVCFAFFESWTILLQVGQDLLLRSFCEDEAFTAA